MPVLNIGGRRVVETGVVVMPTGVRDATISVGGSRVQIQFQRDASASGQWSQGLGPDDFILALAEPTAETVGFWAGTVRDSGSVFNIAVMSRAVMEGSTHAVAFDYAITV